MGVTSRWVVIVPLAAENMEYVIMFDFLASNDKAEYEALSLGFWMRLASGAQYVKAKSDS